MAGKDAGVLPRSPREVVPSRSRPPVVLPAVIAAEGVAFAVLAGVDGSAEWQAARVLLVVVVTAWAVWFTRRAARRPGRDSFAPGIAAPRRRGCGQRAPKAGWTRSRRSSCW